jgi:hypothetical protein
LPNIRSCCWGYCPASSITILQVAANPLAAALGKPEGSHFRLAFSQSFNSFGTFLGPYLVPCCSSKDRGETGTGSGEAARAGCLPD